jgi:hypothetical protein
MATIQCDKWVERVLGLSPTLAGSDETASIDAARNAQRAWKAGRKLIRRQLKALGRRLAQTGDPILIQIAAQLVGELPEAIELVMDSVLERMDQPPAMTEAITRAKEFIKSDPRLIACDNNPLLVPVALRSTIGRVIDAIAAQLPERSAT